MIVDPTLDVERGLHAVGHRRIIGVDEVGRGALAGPVAVGIVVIDDGVSAIPPGLRDSKMLAEPRRETLAPLCARWVLFSAVGSATAREIDEWGLTRCLGLAGRRALDRVRRAGADLSDATVLLDGSFDGLSPALGRGRPPVITRIKADRDCASVAAASVIAKVHRDGYMIRRARRIPGYHWERNKGYGSAQHREAIVRLGITDDHRRTWLTRGPVGLSDDG